MILPSLLLQKPSRNSEAKDPQLKLTERLKLWKEGRISDILEEGRNIQRHLKCARLREPEDIARIFANLMLQGKANSALKFLTEDHDKGGIPPLTETVLGELIEKHPEAGKIHPNTLLQGPIKNTQASYFDSIDELMIQQVAMQTREAGGPQQLDAAHPHILAGKTYEKEGKEMREQVVLMAKTLATTITDPSSLESYIACRLIPLDKCPGLRPIGIGEILQ